MALEAHEQLSAYDDSALLYHSEREYVDWLVRIHLRGIGPSAAVLVAVPGNRLASLRVRWVTWRRTWHGDIMGFGRDPGRILAVQLAFI